MIGHFSKVIRDEARARRTTLVVVVLCLALFFICLIALAAGIPNLSLSELGMIVRGGGSSYERLIVLQLRLPRFMLGILAGASLALSGVLLQDTLGNALAGPELLGVAAGATVVMAAITIFSIPVAFILYPVLGLFGSFTSSGIVLLAARRAHNPIRLALIGAAVSALLDAVMIGMISLGTQQQVQLLYQYLLGSLAARTWAYVQVELPWALIGIPIALLCAGPLNLLRLGDDVAEGLGLPVTRTRILILILCAALVSSVVAVAGPIGYIALLAPHATRRLLGTQDARFVLPVSALLGAILLSGSDLLARLTFAPQELPVGLWTTILGGPIILLLLRQPQVVRAGSAPSDPLPSRRGKYEIVLALSFGAAAVLTVLHIGIGQVLFSPNDVIAALVGHPREAYEGLIIWALRVPRALIALVTGAMLGMAGALFQSVSRNPLAEPTLTGVSAGGVLLAVIWVTLVPGATQGDYFLPVATMLGGLAAGGLVYALNWHGRVDPLQLLLTGVIVSAIASSCASLLLVLHEKALGSILIWVIGSLEGRAWDQWAILWPWAVLLLPLGLLSAALTNTLGLGDDIARSLGVRVERARVLILIVAVLLTAASVAVVGAIGFISLIGPHIGRRIVGNDARRLFPLSMAITSALLIASDMVAQTIGLLPGLRSIAATQVALPVGAVTALLGAPFFLLLLTKGRNT